MAISKVDIANMALLKLGQPGIMSLEDKSASAQRCAQEVDSALETVLRAYPWPFAVVRKELPRLAEVPTFGFDFYYEMPVDLLRLIELSNGGLPYELEGARVATNADHIFIKYVSRSQALERMDAQTKDVVAAQLAFKLAIITTENAQFHKTLFDIYERQLMQARSTWAFEQMPQAVIEGNWLPSRFGRADVEVKDFNPWGYDGTGIAGPPPRGPGVL